jgi:hypothetical protein
MSMAAGKWQQLRKYRDYTNGGSSGPRAAETLAVATEETLGQQ